MIFWEHMKKSHTARKSKNLHVKCLLLNKIRIKNKPFTNYKIAYPYFIGM